MTAIIRKVWTMEDKETNTVVVAFDYPVPNGQIVWRHISSLYNLPIGQLYQGEKPAETVWMREGSMEQHLMSVSLVNIDEGELNDQETTTTL